MCLRELDRLIGTAMTDTRFCDAFLNSHRQEAIVAFDLTAEEQAVLLRIQARTLQEFAQALYQWMSAHEHAALASPPDGHGLGLW
jgi:hypothetical protein